MRRTQSRQAELALPLTAEPRLAEIACRRCGRLGVTIVALGRDSRGAREAAWCGPDCARADGNPWFAGATPGASMVLASS